jgi:phage nucleotide-binding protein
VVRLTQYSYSRVSLFENCPYHFKLKYIDKLTELPRYDADNPLIIGHALHTGIEHDVKTALDEYYNAFPVLTDEIINEAIKLEILIPKVKDYLYRNFEDFEFIHEYKIDHEDYIGFVDLILKAPDGTCMVMDFKYSNNIKNYLDSGQLHIYKDYLEKDGFDVQRLAYLFVPKTSIKQKENEDLYQYRKRLIEIVEESEVTLVPIKYDDMELIYFQNNIKKIETAKEWPKNVSGKCFSCNPRFAPNYLEAIQNEKGEIELVLPKNERRELTIDEKPDFWIYGDSYVGKSTFVDKVENVLFLNTDGNTDNTTAPVIPIKDEVKKEGRRTVRTFAWEIFLDVINALETEENTYEAVAIDLLEDLYEHCRFYVFEQNGWEHESDGSYGKGWSKVTTEWQKAIKRLKALGYQIIYISKELRVDITLKGGSVRTTFRPNINEKVANFLTGTVDLTMRAFSNSDDERFLQLEKKNNVFGGGRYDWKVETCPLDYDEFLEELKEAQKGKVTKTKNKPKKERKKRDEPKQDEVVDKKVDAPEETPEEEEKPKRQRRSRKSEETEETEETPKRERKRRERKPVEDDDTPPGESDIPAADPAEEETPRRRRRRTRVGGDD